EKDRASALAEVRRFIDARFAEPWAPADRRTAHSQGYTKDEADRLASPRDATSPRGIYWACSRCNIKIGALVSEGI
ncbi:class I SAM-dependent methyltransferase family protein, partial [Rhizobium ruizarguesonis]